MDPLDQRLTNAGAAWRESQPDPVQIERLIAGLERHPRRLFAPRAALLFAAGLVIVAAVAVAPGVGSFFNPVATVPTPSAATTPTPSATTSPSSTPSGAPASASTRPSQPTDAAAATTLIRTYEEALVAGDWRTAFDLLGPQSLTHEAGLASYATERAAYYESVAGRYTIGTATPVVDGTPYEPVTKGADLSRAYLIEVDYPAMAGNNAGYEQFVVAPDASGAPKIWPVR
jgi:hypothetical protein